MTVTLYNCASASNVLNKSYTAVTETPITATAKGVIDIDAPSLLLDYSSMDFNYFYILEFGRYYNVTSRSLSPAGKIVITGQSDPLESFASQISALEPLIVRCEESEYRNRYLADSSIPIPSDPQYEVIEGEEIIPALSAGNYIIGVV